MAKISRRSLLGCRQMSLRGKIALQSRLTTLKPVDPFLAKGKIVEKGRLTLSLVGPVQIRKLANVMHSKGSKPEFLGLNLKEMSHRRLQVSQESRNHVSRHHLR